jgi:hypothetical protein
MVIPQTGVETVLIRLLLRSPIESRRIVFRERSQISRLAAVFVDVFLRRVLAIGKARPCLNEIDDECATYR